MSNTLVLSTTTTEVDASNVVLSSTEKQTVISYTEKCSGILTVNSSASYFIVPSFLSTTGGVSAITYARIKSLVPLNVKLNAGVAIYGSVYDFIFNGSITQVEVSQTSGAAVDIIYEFYG